MPKITFFEYEPWERELYAQALPGMQITFFEHALTESHIPEDTEADILSGFVGSSFSEAVLARFSNARFIATRSTGFDHVDLKACKARGILVSNVPSYGSRTVAEYTFLLILALARKLVESTERVRRSASFDLRGLRGSDLQAKTLGVIGTGRIGREVVQTAHGFNMRVLAYDVLPDEASAIKLGFYDVSLDELLASSDVVSLHVPLLPSTLHLLDRTAFQKMKRSALLVNTARGAVVDSVALIEALEHGEIAGAALDVLEEEGAVREEHELVLHGHPGEQSLRVLLQNHMLMRMSNVIVTPHNAFNTGEALAEIARVTAENISAFASGRPVNLVQ
jgi:D-lactate dehydrogenase